MMFFLRSFPCLLTAFLLTVIAIYPRTAEAQGRPSGLRVTVTGVNGNTGEVSFDVTLNTVGVYGNPTLTAPTGLLGDYIFTTFYATTYPPGFTGTLLDPPVNALDHGNAADVTGNLVPRGKIPQTAPGTYRGSFTYTYPDAGPHTIQSQSAAMLSRGTTATSITTGSPIINPNQTPNTAGTQSVVGSWVGRSFFGGSTTYNLVGPLGQPFAWGVQNSATVTFGSVGDTVWCDGVTGTGNGVFDAGEGLAGVEVLLYDDIGCDGIADGAAIATQDTVGDGQYLFESLSLGPAASAICFVAEVNTSDPDLGACSVPDTPAQQSPAINIDSPADLNVDFAFVEPLGSIGDTVWCDGLEGTGNGTFDAGEGVAGVGLELFEDTNCDDVADGAFIATTDTAGDGQYSFPGLRVGAAGDPLCYAVTVDATDPDLANCVQPLGPTTLTPDLEVGATDSLDNDFGFEIQCADGDSDGLCNESCIDDRDGDGEPDCSDYDPSGYLYCESTGLILQGGSVAVAGPGTIDLQDDGSSGRYTFFTDGTPGTYTLTLTPPSNFPMSTECTDLGSFDPTGLPDPVVLGSGETLSTGILASSTCADNPFHLTFELEPGDPFVINNNIPFASCGPLEVPAHSSNGLATLAALLVAAGFALLWLRRLRTAD